MKLFILGLLDDTSPAAPTIQRHAVIMKNELERIDPGAVGLRPLFCWDHGFESRLGHGCSSLVFFVCCVGSGHCDERISRSEDSYWCLCAYLSSCVCVCVCVCARARARLIVCDLETSTMKPPRQQLRC
jgi:hypothetical protein